MKNKKKILLHQYFIPQETKTAYIYYYYHLYITIYIFFIENIFIEVSLFCHKPEGGFKNVNNMLLEV